jgi:hypothetical protein
LAGATSEFPGARGATQDNWFAAGDVIYNGVHMFERLP